MQENKYIRNYLILKASSKDRKQSEKTGNVSEVQQIILPQFGGIYYSDAMPNIRIFSLLFFLLAFTSAQSYGGVFAFSWFAGYCQDEVQNHREACDHTQVTLWDSQSFTIHGLWPDTASPTSYGAFNLALLQKELKLYDDMHNYWPPKAKASSSSAFLWQHEWEAHGKDYANILFKLKPESFPGTADVRNAALQLAFYKDVIAFYQRFKVKKLGAGTYTHAAIASAMGIASSHFVMVCTSSNIVREMQVCFDIAKTGITTKACTKTTNCAGGGQTVQLLDWRMKGQSRVTNYPSFLTTE